MSARLSTLYQDVVAGSYDCVDRILLNGYFGLGHSAGGFRVWWRQLTGSDQTLDKTHLMRLANRFSRRLRSYARAHGIPVVEPRSDRTSRVRVDQGRNTSGAAARRQ